MARPHLAELRRRRPAYVPTGFAASHDNHEKINSWISFTFMYGYSAPLDLPKRQNIYITEWTCKHWHNNPLFYKTTATLLYIGLCFEGGMTAKYRKWYYRFRLFCTCTRRVPTHLYYTTIWAYVPYIVQSVYQGDKTPVQESLIHSLLTTVKIFLKSFSRFSLRYPAR